MTEPIKSILKIKPKKKTRQNKSILKIKPKKKTRQKRYEKNQNQRRTGARS
jgi:hypothetical protein